MNERKSLLTINEAKEQRIMSKQRVLTPSKTTILNWIGNRFTPLEIKMSKRKNLLSSYKLYEISEKFLTGFTLVELLVVIAIIALLMSILLPALGRVRRQAKDVICETNLHQWGTCFAMYADDWDGEFMRGWTDNTCGETKNTDYWMQALRPCYKEGDLRLCPMATKPGTEISGNPGDCYGGIPPDSTFVAWGVFPGDTCGEPSSQWPPSTACDYGSYGNNSYICNPPIDCVNIQGHPMENNWRHTRVKGGAYIPLLGDEQWIDCWHHDTDMHPDYEGQPCQQLTTGNMMVRVCINRLDGFVKWVFLDYSVQKLPLRCLWKQRWHRTFDINAGPTDAEFLSTGTGWLARFPSCK